MYRYMLASSFPVRYNVGPHYHYKADYMKRKQALKVYVTPEEKTKAEQLATAQGLTLSTYLRRCILLAPMPETPQQQQAA